jgi:hypothetical protein
MGMLKSPTRGTHSSSFTEAEGERHGLFTDADQAQLVQPWLDALPAAQGRRVRGEGRHAVSEADGSRARASPGRLLHDRQGAVARNSVKAMSLAPW